MNRVTICVAFRDVVLCEDFCISSSPSRLSTQGCGLCWLPDSQLRLFHGGRESQNSNNAKTAPEGVRCRTHTHTNIQTFVTVWNRYPPRTKYLTIYKAWSIMRTRDLFWLLMRANQKTDAWFGAGDSCCLVLHTSPEMQLELCLNAAYMCVLVLMAVAESGCTSPFLSPRWFGWAGCFINVHYAPSCSIMFKWLPAEYKIKLFQFLPFPWPSRGNHMTSVLCTASYCDAKLEVEHYSASEHRVTTSEFRW